MLAARDDKISLDSAPSGPAAAAADGEAQPEPLISVLLPTVHPWPAVADALHAVLSQTESPPFEVLLLDGHGEALAEPPRHPFVRWIRLPGHDSFELRGAGVARARGSIVAITEDHCIVPPDWVGSIAVAHRADSSPAIVGAVVNHPDSATSARDRANFILTFAGQTPSRLGLGHGRLPVPTNVSFKRRALRSTTLEAGELEYRWLAELRSSNSLGMSDAVVLQHRQSWGKAVWRVHAASGRSYGAAVHSAPLRTRVVWWLSFPIVPIRLMRLVFAELQHGAAGRPASFADFLYTAALVATNLGGQVAGALFGSGTSRRRL